MVGIEISRAARWTAPDIDALEAIGTERAGVAARLLRHSLEIARGRGTPGDLLGAGCPDGAAMTVVLDRSSVLESGRYYVDVETRGELTAGETVVDRRGVTGREPNTTVIHAIDAGRFKALVHDACR
jgi:inosine-uridine nucleoside N-ribohydrolase